MPRELRIDIDPGRQPAAHLAFAARAPARPDTISLPLRGPTCRATHEPRGRQAHMLLIDTAVPMAWQAMLGRKR